MFRFIGWTFTLFAWINAVYAYYMLYTSPYATIYTVTWFTLGIPIAATLLMLATAEKHK